MAVVDSIETLREEVRRLQSQVQIIGENPSLDILQGNTVDTERLYERILEECDGEEASFWETNCEVLVEVVCSLHDAVDVLINKVKQTALKNDELDSKLAELQTKHAKLEENERRLVVGQIAFEVDQVVLDSVLKGIGSPEELAIFTISAMERAIKKRDNYSDAFRSEAERQEVEKRWNALKSKLGWNGRHFRYIRELKNLRLSSAHPKLDIEATRKALAQLYRTKCLSAPTKETCEEFLAMIERIPKLG